MKKTMALVLAVALALGMCTAAMGATERITDIIKPIDTNNDHNGDAIPGEVWEFALTADMFEWNDGNVSRTGAVAMSQLERADIELRVTGASDRIMEVSLEGNSGGSYVRVEFNEDYMDEDTEDFRVTIYLALDGSRQEASRIVLEGELGNPTKEVSDNDSTLKMQDGTIYEATDTLQDVECEVGEGILIVARMYEDEKYGAVAYSDIQRSDDRLLSLYDDVYAIIALDTIGFRSSSATRVIFEDGDYEDDYVYDEDGEYIGRAPREMPLSGRYYISSRRYENLSTSGNGNSGSSSSSQSSSSRPGVAAGSGSGSASGGGAANAQGAAITTQAAKDAASAAASAARAAGQASASVRFLDRPSISAAALKTIPASANGMPVSMIADTMSGRTVVGRITINPNSAANLTRDISLGVYVDSGKTGSIRNLFGQWFNNNVEVVSMAQQGAFGMTVRIAAKVDLSRLNTNSLVFYSYDRVANKYNRISTSFSIDSVGYLHFSTAVGGDIVITDRELSRK